MDTVQNVPVLILSGPVGVGKTSVVLEIADLLGAERPRLAVVDFDALTWCFPSAGRSVPPAARPAQPGRGLGGYQAAAERLVIARVVEAARIWTAIGRPYWGIDHRRAAACFGDTLLGGSSSARSAWRGSGTCTARWSWRPSWSERGPRIMSWTRTGGASRRSRGSCLTSRGGGRPGRGHVSEAEGGAVRAV